MSRNGLAVHGLLRACLAVVIFVDLLSFCLFIAEARAHVLADGLVLGPFADVGSRAVVAGALAVLGFVAAVAFARRPGRLWEGLLVLVVLALLSTVHTQLTGSPWRHLFFSGLCLAGWLAGLAVQRYRGAPADETLARVGSIALLGASYLNSGISKIVYGGNEWLSGLPMQAAILGQQGLVPDGIASLGRSWVVATPAAVSLLSFATVGLELAGPLMLVGPRLRRGVALGLAAMHLTIYVLTTHILYWESIALLVAFGLSADALPAEAEPQANTSIRSRGLAFAAVAGFLTLCALVAVGRQARRYAIRQAEAAHVAATPLPTATIAPLARVGPFALGQTFAETWAVTSFELRERGFVVALSGEPGLARFEITCAPSQAVSPFDHGPLHIFYPNDLELRQVEPLGRALQAQARQTTEGQDACVELASWLESARAGGSR